MVNGRPVYERCYSILKDEGHIIETLNGLCDYIREKYDMEKSI